MDLFNCARREVFFNIKKGFFCRGKTKKKFYFMLLSSWVFPWMGFYQPIIINSLMHFKFTLHSQSRSSNSTEKGDWNLYARSIVPFMPSFSFILCLPEGWVGFRENALHTHQIWEARFYGELFDMKIMLAFHLKFFSDLTQVCGTTFSFLWIFPYCIYYFRIKMLFFSSSIAALKNCTRENSFSLFAFPLSSLHSPP